MAQGTVTLYTTQFCSHCVRAKRLLEKLGVPYEEVDASRSPESRQQLVEMTGRMTFPQILVGTHSVGGYDDLVLAIDNGSLVELIKAG